MLRYQSLVAPALRIAFTSVDQGNLALHVLDDRDAVLLRRRDLERGLGLGTAEFTYMNQVHSADVITLAEHPSPKKIYTGDALLSPDASIPLAVMVADCVPVVFAGKTSAGPISAVAHAGRRGLLDGILSGTVTAMREHGAQSIEAWIGPSICGSCYEVPPAMAEESEKIRPGISCETRWGTPGLNLPEAARVELSALNVTVSDSNKCTMEDEKYFSYRQDPQTGRLAGLIWTDG
ncbi:copper oxidase [Arthrobacter sp. MYb227]|uniref:polyphenol oxidase family protein n=1 Tax=Arthrobacter sp. MYb227 TaxID=1848601 RepID=UPI000CFCA824|nr:polyphenol oxidase family protein [Arthrobacter sp. MYb227]PQZ95870.1 copper oxidase [Arthrobacter sp. MYb227]